MLDLTFAPSQFVDSNYLSHIEGAGYKRGMSDGEASISCWIISFAVGPTGVPGGHHPISTGSRSFPSHHTMSDDPDRKIRLVFCYDLLKKYS